MILKEIYRPISKELLQVETELKKQIETFNTSPRMRDLLPDVKQIINYFFKPPGKYIRPALVLLSAKSVNPQSVICNPQLIRFATAVELIHSASLIHDDIVDNEFFRRGQLSLNKQFGNQIAVLAGDMLYTHAFSLLFGKVDSRRRRILKILLQCVEKMSLGEIYELQILNCELRNAKCGLRNADCEINHSMSPRLHTDREEYHKPGITFGDYLKIIEYKTASFMSACCQCGAVLNGTDERLSQALGGYGLNLGMAYQIIDDYIDKDSVSPLEDTDIYLPLAEEFVSKSKQSIKILPDSVYKEKLYDLADYILTAARPQKVLVINDGNGVAGCEPQ